MKHLPDLTGLARYLTETGWNRLPDWRGAQLWEQEGVEIVVPPDLEETEDALLLDRALQAIARHEGRDVAQVAQAIDADPDEEEEWRVDYSADSHKDIAESLRFAAAEGAPITVVDEDGEVVYVPRDQGGGGGE